MNEQNYTSLPVSKKLVENGIVLETEVYWRVWDGNINGVHDSGSELVTLDEKKSLQDQNSEVRDIPGADIHYYPAPSFAELWRELPDSTCVNKDFDYTKCWVDNNLILKVFQNVNPAYALAELLIWVKEQNRGRIVNKLIRYADKLKW